jgi:hypothetical protein
MELSSRRESDSASGKTLFLLYALARACFERRPVAVAWSDKALYYFDGGQYCGGPRHRLNSATEHAPVEIALPQVTTLRGTFAPETLILWDSGFAIAPPEQIRQAPFLVVVSTSPQRSRWVWAEKEFVCGFFHVNVPSGTEIRHMA